MSKILPGSSDPTTVARPRMGRVSPTPDTPSHSPGDQLALEAECDRLSEALAALQGRLQVLESEREFLTLHLKNLDLASRHLAGENTQAAARIHQLELIEQQYHVLEQHYHAMVGTLSWRLLRRLAAPVRLVGRVTRRLVGRFRHLLAILR